MVKYFLVVSLLLHFGLAVYFYNSTSLPFQGTETEQEVLIVSTKNILTKAPVRKTYKSQLVQTPVSTQTVQAVPSSDEEKESSSEGNFTLQPQYPYWSRLKKEEGIVRAQIICHSNGKCYGELIASSGFERLDTAILQSIEQLNVKKNIEQSVEYEFKLRK